MNKNTTIANCVTVGGIGLALAIAQLPILASAGIMVATIAGCSYLTKKNGGK